MKGKEKRRQTHNKAGTTKPGKRQVKPRNYKTKNTVRQHTKTDKQEKYI